MTGSGDGTNGDRTAQFLERHADPFDAINVIEAMDAWVCLLDPTSSRIVYINRIMCNALGFETHELLGTEFKELIPASAPRDTYESILQFPDKAGWMPIHLYTQRRGVVRVQYRGKFVEHDGKVLILSSMLIDRKLVQSIAPQNDDSTFWKNFNATMWHEIDFDPKWLMDRLPIGVGVATPDGMIRYVNETYGGWLGREPASMIGDFNADYLADGLSKNTKALAMFKSVLTFGWHDWIDISVHHKNGRRILLRTRATLERLKGVNCLVGIFDRRNEVVSFPDGSPRDFG